MNSLGKITIPLVRPDLNRADLEQFLQQITAKSLTDITLVNRWEEAWQDIWQRHSVAFADTNELFKNLKKLLNWQSGAEVETSPLLQPIWREALLNSWLTPSRQPLLNDSGQEMWGRQNWITTNSPVLDLIQHNFGLPAQPATGRKHCLEDISAIINPLPTTGFANIQIVALDGNKMVQGGATSLVLSTDQTLISALKKERKHPPAAGVCALGLSQLSRVGDLMGRRQQLADRYLNLYNQNSFTLPPSPKTGRMWEAFIIQLPNQQKRQELQLFLNKAGIGAAPPIWYHIELDQEESCLNRLSDHSLALPLYASLSDAEQKKIINRIHRWVDRDST
ncbi:MAG: DegT/DnrJ/EryC1/StrS aminotransferase family protein [Magnetococcales bacterium]|nr:DegT/DnrJ/EryC1/StrS aminotransferase family protein [Magnetococcales bacterium]